MTGTNLLVGSPLPALGVPVDFTFATASAAATAALAASPEVAMAVQLGIGGNAPVYSNATLFADTAPKIFGEPGSAAKPVSALSTTGDQVTFGGVTHTVAGFLFKPDTGTPLEKERMAFIEEYLAKGEMEEAWYALDGLSDLYKLELLDKESKEVRFWAGTLELIGWTRQPKNTQEFFDRAESLYLKKGDTASATKVILARARYLVSKGEGEWAAKEYSRAVEVGKMQPLEESAVRLEQLGSTTKTPDRLFREAVDLVMAEYFAEARVSFGAAAQLFGTEHGVERQKALDELAILGAFERDIKAVTDESAIARAILSMRAGTAMRAGRFEKAERIYSALAAANKNMAEELQEARAMAECADTEALTRRIEIKDPERALGFYKRLESQYCEWIKPIPHAMALYSQARVLRRLKKYDDADAAYLRGARIVSKWISDADGNSRYGFELSKLGDEYLQLWKDSGRDHAIHGEYDSELAVHARTILVMADDKFTRHEAELRDLELPTGPEVDMFHWHAHVLDGLQWLVDNQTARRYPEGSDLYWKKALALEMAGTGGMLEAVREAIGMIAMLDHQTGLASRSKIDWASVRTNNARRARRVGKYYTARSDYERAIDMALDQESSQEGSTYGRLRSLVREYAEMWMELGDALVHSKNMLEACVVYAYAIKTAIQVVEDEGLVTDINARWQKILEENGIPVNTKLEGLSGVVPLQHLFMEKFEGTDLTGNVEKLAEKLKPLGLTLNSVESLVKYAAERRILSVIEPVIGDIIKADSVLIFEVLAAAVTAHSRSLDLGGSMADAFKAAVAAARLIYKKMKGTSL